VDDDHNPSRMNNKAANSSGSKRKNAIRIKKDLEKMNALLESKEGPFGKGEICFSITGEVEKKGSRQYDVAHAFIQGEEGTPYEGGLFEMKVLIPEDYPLRSPICQFQTKLFHPKTNLRGDCSHFGQPNDHCETWKASITVKMNQKFICKFQSYHQTIKFYEVEWDASVSSSIHYFLF